MKPHCQSSNLVSLKPTSGNLLVNQKRLTNNPKLIAIDQKLSTDTYFENSQLRDLRYLSDNPRFKHGDALSLTQKRVTAHKSLKRLETPNLGSLI